MKKICKTAFKNAAGFTAAYNAIGAVTAPLKPVVPHIANPAEPKLYSFGQKLAGTKIGKSRSRRVANYMVAEYMMEKGGVQ